LLLSSCAVLTAGCGHHAKAKVEAPDSYDWSDYEGTYANGPGDAAKSDASANAGDDAGHDAARTARTARSEAPAKSAADEPAEAPPVKKKLSRGTIQGESVSSITADAISGASKSVLRAKVLSSNVIVGPEYEQVQVVLKGAAVQIVRPAGNPDASGPKLRSPKARSSSVAKTDSSWFDKDADVLVLVRASKRSTSKKLLAALLKHGRSRKHGRRR
jgi:hypothetical protein